MLWTGIFAIALTSFSTQSLAQTATDSGTQTLEDPQGGAVFTTNPALEDIDELTPYVDVTFHGLVDDNYVLCTGSNYCLYGDDTTPVQIPTLVLKDRLKNISSSEYPVSANGSMTIRLCGDGSQKVKLCKDGSGNWFHGGNFYVFSIGISNNGVYSPIKRAAFYVGLSYPEVTMSPSTGITTSNTLTMNITGAKKNGGSTNNNYQIVIFGPGIKKETCRTITSSQSFPFGNLKPGAYTFYINEQVNDKSTGSTIKDDVGSIGSGSVINRIGDVGKTVIDVTKGKIEGFADIVDGVTGTNITDNCQGGFTYYKISCKVTLPAAQGGKGGSCTDPEKSKDPNGSEYSRYLKQLSALDKIGLVNPLPCSDPVNNQDPATCKKINTAVGQIDVTPQGFINSIFRFVLLVAAFGGIVIIVYAGYIFMISRGDKEKLSAARDTLTSAIVGLLFIVLSIVILEIIGVDILRIPGFTR